MNKIIVCRGLQGSGKSTFAKQFCETNRDWVRVNRDDIRTMRGAYWIPKDEDMITNMEYECIKAALSAGRNVIIDAMNLNPDRVEHRMKCLKQDGFDIDWEYKNFTKVSLEDCIANDLKRVNSVGEKVIRDTYNKYLRKIEVYSESADLPHCIIVDVDGTLADHTGIRSPYDWKRVGEDKPNKHIIGIVRRFSNTHKIIIFSGRDEICRAETKEWLNRHSVPYHMLFMRLQGTSDKDTIQKTRMFNDYVKGRYYVDFVLDDRNSVVELWRSMGLNCLQVAEGNF